MRNKWTGFIVLFLLVINTSALATMAYNRWFKHDFLDKKTGSESSHLTLQKTLDLENSQSQHMGKCRMTFCQETDPIRQQMQGKKLQLIDEIKKSDPVLSEIDNLIDEIIQMESEIQKKAIRRILEDKTILTPLQQERFLGMFEHHVIRGGRDCCPGEKTDKS